MIGLFWACFYLNFLEVSARLDVRHCPKVQSCAISRKTNDANSKNGEKRHFRRNLVPLGLNSGHHFFSKALALSVTRYYPRLSSCTISEKTNDPILILSPLVTKRTDGRTDGQKDSQKDEINFI